MISIELLSKSYGSLNVLKDISISFEPAKVYGIVGQNGAGKTTLFRCIAGLEKYDGRISCDTGRLKDQLGFLMTEPYFFSKITGAEYIRLMSDARSIKPGDLQRKNIFNLPLNQYASTYSTGMKKKLALTAILLQDNQYFILDEPFNGVDIQSNMLIAEIIHTLRGKGKTIVLSSHIFQTLRESCDEIYLIEEGRIEMKVGKDRFSELESKMKPGSATDSIASLGL
jgi:ABC-2 type transport system ATP-binding protein